MNNQYRDDTLCKTVEDDIRYHINLVTNDKDKLIKDLLAKYNINNQVSLIKKLRDI